MLLLHDLLFNDLEKGVFDPRRDKFSTFVGIIPGHPNIAIIHLIEARTILANVPFSPMHNSMIVTFYMLARFTVGELRHRSSSNLKTVENNTGRLILPDIFLTCIINIPRL